ncbi:type VI secretion protein, partial [[Eubacterium] siraeum]|nr:type VI secretion protein [[Eubacterium] siraeum]
IDTIELLLIKLYEKFGISDETDWSRMQPSDYPILSDFDKLIEAEYKAFNPKEKSLYTAENLQNICLCLHSLCKGAESKFFDGHTNITDNNFVTFGVKGLLQASKNIRNALLFNGLAYMSEQLLSRGNTV